MFKSLVKISDSVTAAEVRFRTAWGSILSKILPFHPNAITAARFIISITLLFPISDKLALLVAVLVILGDFADGIIARTTGKVTFIGSLADPLADRFFGFSFMIYLSVNKILPLKLAGLIICLEIGRWLYVYLLARHRGDEIKPNFFARLQICTL